MTLEGFKTIFWFEYAHRCWAASSASPSSHRSSFSDPGPHRRPLVPKLAVMFVLGAAQGVLGWYMVKSGLIDRPERAPIDWRRISRSPCSSTFT
jgi:cytochrome c oxidase assembly protein subunit 15